ncbi:MAG: AAA family ATPase [Bdellovibrionaceae bacterium]|nr:AAA family ATPase [Pseudobdellovibrionaceae bacterium]
MSILLPFKKMRDRAKDSDTEFYAFGGGKGGIGKTFLSSNFSIYLAKKGRKTLLVDLDLGGANAHTYLGVQPHGHNLKDFLRGRVNTIQDVIAPTNTPNLYLIKGLDDWTSEFKISEEEIQNLITALKSCDFDDIIFDLAAGTHNETIEFFLASDKKVVVTTPEPTSIENSYQFLKRAFHKQLMKASQELNCHDEIAKLLLHKERFNLKTPAQLLYFLEEREPNIGRALKKKIREISPQILVNQARSHQDQMLPESIQKICAQYFDMKCVALGSVNYESAIWQSLRALKPFQIEQFKSNTSNELVRVYDNLFDDKLLRNLTRIAI